MARGIGGRFFIGGLILAALVVLASPPVQAQTTLERIAGRGGTLVAAAVPDQLPLAAYGADGKLTGFDVEVARALALELGFDISFVTPGWDAILGGDWRGEWDMAVASITPTAGRAETLSFPGIYRYDMAVLVVPIDNETVFQPDQVSGKRIGVKADTTFEKYLKGRMPVPQQRFVDLAAPITDAEIVPFAGKDEAIAALVKGNSDNLAGVVTSFATARAASEQGQPIRIVPGMLFVEPVAVAAAKGDRGFSEAVRRALLVISENGTLPRLSHKWFGVDLTEDALLGVR